MQPLYSVDHETRQSSHRADEELQQQTSEETSLLHRYPQIDIPRSTSTTMIVSLLLLILISGVVIGIYLLILQSDSENVLPPVEMPLQLVSRVQWDQSNRSEAVLPEETLFKANQLIIMHTDSEQCWDTKSCVKFLKNLQMNVPQNILPYNFLISSNGQTYEALGWHKLSPMFPNHKNALVLAFIGNFTNIAPTAAQLQEVQNFVSESISHQYLNPSFLLVGKSVNSVPKRLFKSMSDLPQWSSDLSDST